MGTAIAFGEKTVECRTWDTRYRGDLLICTTQRRELGGVAGHAIAVVRVADTRPFTEDDLGRACMYEMPERPSLAWDLADLRLIEPFPVKGRQHFFNVDDDLVKVVSEGADAGVLERLYKPLAYIGKDKDAAEMWDFG